MRLRSGVIVTVVMLAAIVILLPLAYEKQREFSKPEQYQLIYREGPRSWLLDTRALAVNNEPETAIRYLDVYVKATYTFTTDYDVNKYWLRLDAREWQPISATGCDAGGKVLEL